MSAAFAWNGRPDPHARQGCSASSVTTAFGEPSETKKARYVVASSRVLRGDGVHRFRFPAADLIGISPELLGPSLCEGLGRRFGLLSEAPPVGTQPQARAIIGQAVRRPNAVNIQAVFAPRAQKSCRGGRSAADMTESRHFCVATGAWQPPPGAGFRLANRLNTPATAIDSCFRQSARSPMQKRQQECCM